MFGQITEGRSDLRFPVRVITRSLSFIEESDLDVAEWLDGRQESSRPSDLGRGLGPGKFSASDLATSENRTHSNDPFDSTNRIRSPCPLSGTSGFRYDGIASLLYNA